MSELRLIVGLGNPGRKYEYTRHNLGFLVANHFARERHLKIRSSRLCKGFDAEGEVSQQKVNLLLPQTFMNNSGMAVKMFIEKKDIAIENILVVCDDLTLEFGQLRLRRGGSDGGHNGLASLIEKLETPAFARLRVGVGSPRREEDAAEYVLSEFKSREKKLLGDLVQEAADCCFAWTNQNMEQVMSQYNKRKENV